MFSSEAELIERLRQANQFWRRMALSAICIGVIVLLTATGFSIKQYQTAEQAREEAKVQREHAEQKAQEAQREVQQAREDAHRALYAARIEAAQRVWQAGDKQDDTKQPRP